MKTINVEITQSHINRGVRRNFWSCPIALALIDCTNMSWRVSDKAAYYYQKDGTEIEVILPFEVHRFVKNFDASELVKPFKFEIAVKDTPEI